MKNENITNINFRDMNISVSSLLELINAEEIKLEYFINKPYSIWDNSKKSQFIELFLIRAPIRDIILHDGIHNFSIIDGLMRLSTIYDFFNDGFELVDLKLIHEFNGNKYSDLKRAFQRRIEETYLHIYCIDSIKEPDLAIRIASNYL